MSRVDEGGGGGSRRRYDGGKGIEGRKRGSYGGGRERAKEERGSKGARKGERHCQDEAGVRGRKGERYCHRRRSALGAGRVGAGREARVRHLHGEQRRRVQGVLRAGAALGRDVAL